MKFNPYDLSLSDMNLYFKGTYVRLLKGNNKPKWGVYQGYDSHATHRFQTSEGVVSYSKDEGLRIDSVFPVGFFNRDDTRSVVYGERIAARQNLKGIHFGGNYNLIAIESLLGNWNLLKTQNAELQRGVQYILQACAAPSLGPKQLTQIFEDQDYPTVHKAIAQIKNEGVFARALSPEFAIAPDSTEEGYVVLFHTLPVGILKDGAVKKLKTLIPAYKQELSDFFSHKGVLIQ